MDWWGGGAKPSGYRTRFCTGDNSSRYADAPHLRVLWRRLLLDKLLVCSEFSLGWVRRSERRPELKTLEHFRQNQVCQVGVIQTPIKPIRYMASVHDLSQNVPNIFEGNCSVPEQPPACTRDRWCLICSGQYILCRAIRAAS